MRIIVLFLTSLTLVSLISWSYEHSKITIQTKKRIFISGHVTYQQDTNEYLSGANLIIQGTKLMTQSDSLGYYSLDITSITNTTNQYTLLCFYVGCHTSKIGIQNPINNSTEINIRMKVIPACELQIHGFEEGSKKEKSDKSKNNVTK